MRHKSAKRLDSSYCVWTNEEMGNDTISSVKIIVLIGVVTEGHQKIWLKLPCDDLKLARGALAPRAISNQNRSI